MGKIIYSNISATSIGYPVIDFLLNIKEVYEEGDLLILCFWDYEIYNFRKKEKISENKTKIREITGQLSKLLNGLEMEHKIVYLSDSIKRINSREDIFELLLDCYNNITMGDIEEAYKKDKYLTLRPSTLGKINFIIMDFLVSLFFKEIYPTLTKGRPIDVYHTGERFLGIKKYMEEAISRSELVVSFPLIRYWKTLPILNYVDGNWISLSMSKSEIERIVRDNFPKDKNVLKDLISIGLRLNDESLNHKIASLFKKLDSTKEKELLVQDIAEVFMHYFSIIRKLIESSEEGEIKKITYIDSKDKLQKILELINPSKLEILKHCDGRNSVEDIVHLVSMRESSVRSYLSRMKKEKLVTNNKKPLRLIDEIIINTGD